MRIRGVGFAVSVVVVMGCAGVAGAGEAPRQIKVLPDAGPVLLGGLRPAKAASLEQAVDQCVSADMAATQTPGAAVAVLVDGELLYEQGYGVRRRGGSTPVDAHTVFRIGSVTKMMTAAAVMQQVEAGTVDVNDPVTVYVPELTVAGPWPAELITVRNLLSHTSGFPDQLFDLGPAGEDALAEWAAQQGSVRLHAPPGSFWNYSNPNYALAGLVLERASGTHYRDYIEDQVWGPAGMTSATFDPYRVIAGGDYASGTYRDPTTGQWQTLSPEQVESWWAGPAGWAFSTAGDLVRWAELLMDGGGTVLAPESVAAMAGHQAWCHYTPDMYYGYGVVTDTYNGLDIRYHDGSLIGWGTMLVWVPERHFAVAVLGNTGTPLASAAFCALDAVLQPTPVEPPDLTTDPSTWGPYVGHYAFMDVFGSSFPAAVTLSGEKLQIEVGPGSAVVGAGTVDMEQAYLDTFVIDSDGDGVLDTDLTFISGPGLPPAVRWLRNRYAVGGRLGDFRPGAPRRLP